MKQPIEVKIRGNTYLVERSYCGKQRLNQLIYRLILERLLELEKDWTSQAK